jgi:hypothetical protein
MKEPTQFLTNEKGEKPDARNWRIVEAGGFASVINAFSTELTTRIEQSP